MAEPLEKNLGWREVRERLDHRMRAAADMKGFPGCEDTFCTWVLPECVSHYLCVCLSEASKLSVKG